jgi:Ni,Fe-hydrogenase III component G
VESKKIIDLLKSHLKDQLIETPIFGKSDVLSLWVKASGVKKCAGFLVEKMGFTYLEHLSLAHLNESLKVMSYFLVHPKTDQSLVLRFEHREKKIPSVGIFWPLALPLERQMQKEKGVFFEDQA